MKFMAELSGAAQVPPVETEAMGMADVTVDTEAMTVTWTLAHQGLSATPSPPTSTAPPRPRRPRPPWST
jgi:hypothetical protein